jgi:hypothetical protein
MLQQTSFHRGFYMVIERLKMIWRISFVGLLFLSILTACGDRERVNCPLLTKNKALRAATTITVDTASVGTSRMVQEKCL